MKARPVAVRERIIHLYEQGNRTKEIASVLGYCVAAVRRVRQNFKRRGTLEPQTHQCGRKTLLTPARQARLQALLGKDPDATLAELGAKFKHPTSTMDLWLDRLGYSCKKTLHASEQSRPDVVEQRKAWREKLADLPAAKLVFVDESGANTQMTRRYGRSPVGERLVCSAPQGHYQTTTLIAAVRLQGAQAPWLFAGVMDGEMFLAWVQEGLAPRLESGDIVVLDNLATHKVTGVKEAIEAVGARVEYLPPYSPDFNPIENLWSKMKQILKSRNPRTLRQLYKAAGAAFDAITIADCHGFFLSAGVAV